MIRFLQTPGPFKKYALGGILLVICVSMVWYLVPNNSPLGIGAANAAGVVATVAGEDIHTTEVRQTAQRMIEQQYPQAGSMVSMLIPMAAPQALNSLVNEKVLLIEARRLGLKATDDDLRDYMHTGQYGQVIFPGGKFIGEEAYRDLVSRAGYTVPQFEEILKEEILRNKLRRLVAGSASVTDAEVRKQFDKQSTKVKFDYALIKKDDILKGLHPADAELKAYFDLNQKNYVNSVPEKRQLKYVVFDTAKLVTQTQVTKQDFDAYYDQHHEEFRVPEQVNVRHILIKSPLPGPDGKVDPKALDEARAKAQDVLKQVKASGNFADLAKKYSDDTVSAKNGGSLGFIGKGRTVPEFEKAAFSLPKGGTSDLVQSSYGFHIIHVDEKQEAHLKSVDEVKGQIEPLIKQQKAAQAAQSAATQLLSQARSSGSNLDKAAAAKGLQVITTDFVTRNNLLPGIGTDPQFSAAAFGQTANAPPDEVQLHDGFAIYEVTAVKPPSTPTFDEIRSRVEKEFKNERASSLLAQKTAELSDRAKADHDLKKAAKELGAAYKTSDFVAPDGQVPDIGSMTGPAAAVFTLKPGEISGPITTAASGAVLSVIEQQAPTDADFAAKKDQVRDALLQQKQGEAFALFVGNLRDQMEKSGKVKTNQKELDTLTKARTEEGE
jgi:peptidyl-prolyl cis-trans isomerase D